MAPAVGSTGCRVKPWPAVAVERYRHPVRAGQSAVELAVGDELFPELSENVAPTSVNRAYVPADPVPVAVFIPAPDGVGLAVM